jgi:L-serine dehydratase
VLLGLEGEAPERVDPELIEARLARIRGEHCVRLAGVQPVRFVEREHLVMHRRQSLPYHPNGMRSRPSTRPARCCARGVLLGRGRFRRR